MNHWPEDPGSCLPPPIPGGPCLWFPHLKNGNNSPFFLPEFSISYCTFNGALNHKAANPSIPGTLSQQCFLQINADEEGLQYLLGCSRHSQFWESSSWSHIVFSKTQGQASNPTRPVLTSAIGPGFLGVEFGFKGSPGLELGFGELGQVRHYRVLIHIRVNDFFRSDDLEQRHGEWMPQHIRYWSFCKRLLNTTNNKKLSELTPGAMPRSVCFDLWEVPPFSLEGEDPLRTILYVIPREHTSPLPLK